MFEDRATARGFAAGMLIGGLIGAGIALLVAPHSGEETRRIIRRRAKRIAADAQDRYDDVKDKVEKARRRAEKAISG